ncbi:3-hydroxyacyl-CoA dehydrogenase NAD-binding domain-containing protein [Dongia sp.]|uniref:3-hydroxyacyl-CoA dehydrogenase NAD-binding domain-containing protein n=1 Tax=Dongia sp. TaxID=1977262 RepID=UPI0035B33D14
MNGIAVVGAGSIGASWAALFLAHGLNVTATDARPEAGAELTRAVDAIMPALERDGTKPGRLTFTRDLAACCEGADFVQENIIEREAEKTALIAQIDAILPPDVVIASSSSAISATVLQRACRHPGRVIIGHPFHPAHLVPLVELAGGTGTENWALDRAEAFYAALGKLPVRLTKEIYGHIANRLQAAIFREAIHLLHTGIASVRDIDRAVTEGPGLRWALMGPFQTYHLAGGPNGIRDFMTQFAPMQERLWAELGQPVLDTPLRDAVIAAVEATFASKSISELAQERDQRLGALLNARQVATA